MQMNNLKSAIIFVYSIGKLDIFTSFQQSSDARLVLKADVITNKGTTDAVAATLLLVVQ